MSRCTILAVLVAGSLAGSTSIVHAGGAGPAPVVGGDDVPDGKWPDTVAVLGAKGSCSGTLIAPDVVLTAGHCADIEPTTVIANTTDYSNGTGVHVGVNKTVAYPSWENTYDVSIVILAQPITTVTPRAVATSCSYKQFSASTAVHLVGFGVTNADGTQPNTHLKEAMTQVVDPMCASGNGCNEKIAPGGEFVAGGGTTDSCFGDSGGPVYLDTDHGPIVVGAVSRGVDNSTTPCGGGGIYVRPDKVIEWIESNAGHAIAKDSCAPDPADDSTDPEAASTDTNEIGGCSVTHGPGSSRGAELVVLVAAVLLVSRRRRARRGALWSC